MIPILLNWLRALFASDTSRKTPCAGCEHRSAAESCEGCPLDRVW